MYVLSIMVLFSAPRGLSLRSLFFPSPQKPMFDMIFELHCFDFYV